MFGLKLDKATFHGGLQDGGGGSGGQEEEEERQ